MQVFQIRQEMPIILKFIFYASCSLICLFLWLSQFCSVHYSTVLYLVKLSELGILWNCFRSMDPADIRIACIWY